MSRQKPAKLRPINVDSLRKIRDRQSLFCPYCGHRYKVSWLTRILGRGLTPRDCKSCQLTFLLPMDIDFDPSKVVSVFVDSKHGATCKSCRAWFRMKHKFEQCSCCGQLTEAGDTEPGVTLIDNTDLVSKLLDEYHAREI